MKKGLSLARRKGFAEITCRSVAEECSCCYRTVQRLYRNRRELSRAIIDYARVIGASEVAEEGERLGL
jgi:hypothetical protein